MQTKKYMSVLMSLVLLASVWLISAPARTASASTFVGYGASASAQDPENNPTSFTIRMQAPPDEDAGIVVGFPWWDALFEVEAEDVSVTGLLNPAVQLVKDAYWYNEIRVTADSGHSVGDWITIQVNKVRIPESLSFPPQISPSWGNYHYGYVTVDNFPGVHQLKKLDVKYGPENDPVVLLGDGQFDPDQYSYNLGSVPVSVREVSIQAEQYYGMNESGIYINGFRAAFSGESQVLLRPGENRIRVSVGAEDWQVYEVVIHREFPVQIGTAPSLLQQQALSYGDASAYNDMIAHPDGGYLLAGEANGQGSLLLVNNDGEAEQDWPKAVQAAHSLQKVAMSQQGEIAAAGLQSGQAGGMFMAVKYGADGEVAGNWSWQPEQTPPPVLLNTETPGFNPQTYSDPYIHAWAALPGGGYLLAGGYTAEDNYGEGYEGGYGYPTRIGILVKLDESLQQQWAINTPWTEFTAIARTPDGEVSLGAQSSILVAGYSPEGGYSDPLLELLTINLVTGQIEDWKPISQVGYAVIHDFRSLPGGGYMLAGSLMDDFNTEYADAYAARLDENLQVVWRQAFGSAEYGQLGGVVVRQSQGEFDGLTLYGTQMNNGFKPVLVHLNNAGEVMWKEQYAAASGYTRTVLSVDNGFAALVSSGEGSRFIVIGQAGPERPFPTAMAMQTGKRLTITLTEPLMVPQLPEFAEPEHFVLTTANGETTATRVSVDAGGLRLTLELADASAVETIRAAAGKLMLADERVNESELLWTVATAAELDELRDSLDAEGDGYSIADLSDSLMSGQWPDVNGDGVGDEADILILLQLLQPKRRV